MQEGLRVDQSHRKGWLLKSNFGAKKGHWQALCHEDNEEE
jgi:hypothetical protein